jgi:cell division protein FtsL
VKEEKLKKIVTASTVVGVLLAVLLVSVIIYQLISLTLLKNKKDELKNQIEQYKTVIEQTQDEIEKNSAYWYIEQKAREYGMIYENDEKFED